MKRFTSKLSAVLLSACMVLPVLSNSTANGFESKSTTTTAVVASENEIYFEYEDPENGYCTCYVGGIAGLNLANYDDSFYEIGESPIGFKIEDENVAVIYQIQGSIVHIKGVSVGETVLSATTPDGQTASLKVIVKEAVVTTTTAVWHPGTTTTTTTVSGSYGIGVSQAPDKTVYQIGEELDLTGLRLNGSYTEGELSACIVDEDYQQLLDSNVPITVDASEFDNTKAGTYTIYVWYGNAKDSFTVVVLDDKPASGDVNDDDDFGVSDVVLLQKWLLAVPDTHLANWNAADFCKDGKLNVFDLCLMKRELIRTTVTTYVEPEREILYGSAIGVEAEEISMYLGPDTTYNIVTTIPQGTILNELGVQEDNNNWAFVEYEGQYGWIQMVSNGGETLCKILDLPVADKPVIYLYPEEETDVHVELELTEADLSTTYPKYNNGWDVVAYPDGTLLNKADGSHHKYLFWDAVNCSTRFDFSKGFCVAGGDTETFFKEKLTYMGLTEQETNEFIVYWLPRMEHNAYNLISFQGDAYTKSAKLTITPTPDSECRIFMAYVPLDNAVEIEPQQLETFERKGFSVVEWGGTEIKARNNT